MKLCDCYIPDCDACMEPQHCNCSCGTCSDSKETNMTTNPYLAKQIYWCEACDNKQVDSTDKNTGKFYQVFGHAFETGDYHSVFFALCPECSVLDCLKEYDAK